MISDILKAYYNVLFYPRFPLRIVLYLNNTCNLKCSFCEIGQHNQNPGIAKEHFDMSADNIQRVIALCKRTRVTKIYVTGGEPFLAKNIWYLLKKCSENKIAVDDLTTNGTLLETLDHEQISLLNATVKDIIISIDSAQAQNHDASRGMPGTFNKVQNFVRNAEQKKQFKSTFSFNVVVHNDNIRHLKEIIDLASEWKIRHVNFQPVNPESIFTDLQKISDKSRYVIGQFDRGAFTETLREYLAYATLKKVSTNLKAFMEWVPSYFQWLNSETIFVDKTLPKILCSKVFNYIHINYKGDFIPCTNSKKIAHIEDDDCFEKWQKEAQTLKKMFKEHKYFSYCKYCYCDFPANLRLSLIYYPFHNVEALTRLAQYYLTRNR